MSLDNANPVLYEKASDRIVTLDDEDNDVTDEFDSREIFGNVER